MPTLTPKPTPTDRHIFHTWSVWELQYHANTIVTTCHDQKKSSPFLPEHRIISSGADLASAYHPPSVPCTSLFPRSVRVSLRVHGEASGKVHHGSDQDSTASQDDELCEENGWNPSAPKGRRGARLWRGLEHGPSELFKRLKLMISWIGRRCRYRIPKGVVNGHPLTSKGLLMDTLSVVLVLGWCLK